MSSTIHPEVLFSTSPNRIYEALTSSKQFSEATGGAPTEINSETGGSFSCFGGMILGRYIELLPNKRIVQAWRVANWPEGIYSIAKYELKEEDSKTLWFLIIFAFLKKKENIFKLVGQKIIGSL